MQQTPFHRCFSGVGGRPWGVCSGLPLRRRRRRRLFAFPFPKDYADASYINLDPDRKDVETLYGKVCAQINHLTYDRTDDDSKKIGPLERKGLINLIRDEAFRLGKQLRAGYDKQHLL